ncbi:MAG: 4'-phosphopantetheinyl transferase superfamily protein [Sphingomonadaceae bacterium]
MTITSVSAGSVISSAAATVFQRNGILERAASIAGMMRVSPQVGAAGAPSPPPPWPVALRLAYCCRDFSHLSFGVDVEHISSAKGGAAIAANFFSLSEQKDLAKVATSSFDRRFQRLWTAKEALSKALGLGLNLPFDSFSVVDDGISATIEFGSSDGAFVSETLHVDVGPDCVCAVVSIGQIEAGNIATWIEELGDLRY